MTTNIVVDIHKRKIENAFLQQLHKSLGHMWEDNCSVK